jgi:hypothetical protein
MEDFKEDVSMYYVIIEECWLYDGTVNAPSVYDAIAMICRQYIDCDVYPNELISTCFDCRGYNVNGNIVGVDYMYVRVLDMNTNAISYFYTKY